MKSYVTHQIAPVAMTLSDLEGHFYCLKPYLGEYSTY